MKVVSAYKPFQAESPAHRKLGPFDWPAAIGMLRHSVRESCGCETYALTDLATDLAGPTIHLATAETRLMLWLLEAWSLYIESDDFNQDTVMVSPDALVYTDLRRWFQADLGVVVRGGKFEDKPLLNGVQFWAVKAKDRLAAFYRQVREIAATLPDNAIRWGGDTEPIVRLLAPMRPGFSNRCGLRVHGIQHSNFMRCPSTADLRRIEAGKRPDPVPVVDFKYLKKRTMSDYYASTLGWKVSA